MERSCSVTGKIKCIFSPKVVAAVSHKRKDQQFKIVASEQVNEEFIKQYREGILTPTEKLDGTCCLIDMFQGKPWLWARHDVKPTKAADRRFKAYQHKKNEKLVNEDMTNDESLVFEWDAQNDFKEKPENWKPASGEDPEKAVPDDIGHLVGWVPIDPSLRTHLWHLSVVDLKRGEGLFLKVNKLKGKLQIIIEKLENFIGKTFELIGTNVNANPYDMGYKQNPIHLLVRHGEFKLERLPLMENEWTHDRLKTFFNSNSEGLLEGIVWHSENGSMFKLHRCHLNLPWPIKPLRTSTLPVEVDNIDYDSMDLYRNKLFEKLKECSGKSFENLKDIFAKELCNDGKDT